MLINCHITFYIGFEYTQSHGLKPGVSEFFLTCLPGEHPGYQKVKIVKISGQEDFFLLYITGLSKGKFLKTKKIVDQLKY